MRTDRFGVVFAKFWFFFKACTHLPEAQASKPLRRPFAFAALLVLPSSERIKKSRLSCVASCLKNFYCRNLTLIFKFFYLLPLGAWCVVDSWVELHGAHLRAVWRLGHAGTDTSVLRTRQAPAPGGRARGAESASLAQTRLRAEKTTSNWSHRCHSAAPRPLPPQKQDLVPASLSLLSFFSSGPLGRSAHAAPSSSRPRIGAQPAANAAAPVPGLPVEERARRGVETVVPSQTQPCRSPSLLGRLSGAQSVARPW